MACELRTHQLWISEKKTLLLNNQKKCYVLIHTHTHRVPLNIYKASPYEKAVLEAPSALYLLCCSDDPGGFVERGVYVNFEEERRDTIRTSSQGGCNGISGTAVVILTIIYSTRSILF